MFIAQYLKRTNSFLRFLLVGIVNTFTGLSIIYFILHFLNGSYWIATFFGNAIGAAVSYFLNKGFTFNSDIHDKKGLPRFIGVILVCYVVSYSFSAIGAKWFEGLGASLMFVSIEDMAILLGAGLYTLLNYFGQRHFVFQTWKN